jgi:transposase
MSISSTAQPVVSPRLRQNSKYNKFLDIGIDTACSNAALPVEDVRIDCAALNGRGFSRSTDARRAARSHVPSSWHETVGHCCGDQVDYPGSRGAYALLSAPQKDEEDGRQPSIEAVGRRGADDLREKRAQCGPFALEVMDGATNGGRFRTYVADVLVPALRPGDTAVMDNLAAHKVAGIRHLIEAAGARLLYLPPYSPDLHPLENAFAKKALLRTAAARTVPDLWAVIRGAFTCFKPDECRNYLAAAGYDSHDPA